MNESPIKQNTEPHRTIPAFLMQLDFPKTASVKNYLRTVNFENSEIKVAWTDEHGDWLRQTFASRPDNVVVQWLTAPAGQSVNVRISLQKSAEWTMTSGTTWGNRPARGASKGPEAGDVQQDFNEQRLIYKCRLDPSVDNSGYAGVTRVVRNGGSARMDGSTLVIENASSVMLLTRIEHFPDYSDDKVEALRQAVEQITPDYAALLGTASQGPVGNAQPRHRGFRRRLAIRHVRRGTADRSAVKAGLFARVAGEDVRNGPPLVHPHQRQVSEHRQPRPTSPSTCKRPVWSRPTSAVEKKPDRRDPAFCKRPARCRATSAKAWKPTSIGSRAWPRTAGPTPRTSSGSAARRIPSGRRQGMGVKYYYSNSSDDWRPLALLDFRRRPGLPPVLGPLPGHRRPGFSPQARRAGPERTWRCFTRIS